MFFMFNQSRHLLFSHPFSFVRVRKLQLGEGIQTALALLVTPTFQDNSFVKMLFPSYEFEVFKKIP